MKSINTLARDIVILTNATPTRCTRIGLAVMLLAVIALAVSGVLLMSYGIAAAAISQRGWAMSDMPSPSVTVVAIEIGMGGFAALVITAATLLNSATRRAAHTPPAAGA